MFNLSSGSMTSGEKVIFEKLKNALIPSTLKVTDNSGGCGSMYEVFVESSKFKGMYLCQRMEIVLIHRSLIKQHQLVNSILEKEIKEMHGIQLRTRIANDNN
ncbi:MAG: hypothetical protein SGCHY_005602 [Lobulomycetales sp.]